MAQDENVKKRGRKSKEEILEIAVAQNKIKQKADANSVKSLKNVSKGEIWEYQESTVFQMLKKTEKEMDFFDFVPHCISIIKSAFIVEQYKVEDTLVQKSLEKQGFKLGTYKIDEKLYGIAIKKKNIKKITDFTYENIRHISAAKMLDVIANNFGGGWESISQSIKDIIESGFDISTTTLPKDRLHKEGGMYENKISDGFDVLEIPKGAWIEAIFAKVKPIIEIPKVNLFEEKELEGEDAEGEDYQHEIDMNDEDTDDMTEENYRTTFEIPNIEDGEDMDLSDGLDDDE